MRSALLVVWLILPIAAWAWHEGPGKERAKLDVVARELSRADEAAADEDWHAAVGGYEEALQNLPEDASKRLERSIRLKMNIARMQAEELPKAQKELAQLVDEMAEDESADPALLDDARAAYANAQYYVTWLMRLEGYTREEWEPEIEKARQAYRLVAERAEGRGDGDEATRAKQDMEAAIKLARIDIDELQGLPLPSE